MGAPALTPGESLEALEERSGWAPRSPARWRSRGAWPTAGPPHATARPQARQHALASELRDTNPDINPVIDRLQAEHRRVSDDLDAVEAAANGLADDDGQQARKAVVDALQTLRENLLVHLEYEELNIEATVRRVRQLP
jgi:hypothetical protein